jgi:hypothetical protein
MAVMSTDDMGLAAEILRVDEMDMRLEVDIDECDERAEATEDDGEVDRGVETSEVLVMLLGAYDAIACVKVGRGKKGSRARKTRL